MDLSKYVAENPAERNGLPAMAALGPDCSIQMPTLADERRSDGPKTSRFVCHPSHDELPDELLTIGSTCRKDAEAGTSRRWQTLLSPTKPCLSGGRIGTSAAVCMRGADQWTRAKQNLANVTTTHDRRKNIPCN